MSSMNIGNILSDKLITYVSGIVIKANESIQHRFKMFLLHEL